jgi:perosamine synthetase
MTESFIPIAKVSLRDDEIQAAVDVLRSGYLIQGKRTEEFERRLAETVGAKHAIAVSSGTAALHIAYLAAVEPGSEVLVPTFSHISTASMVHFAGCTPVFCDIDSRTFTVDPDDAKRRLTSNTRAIVGVHLFGNACAIDEILKFAKDHDLKVIWDAAQAHGTRYRGRDVGSFDDLVCYSFYPTKNMITGEGGMITTGSDELAERCRLLRSHGQTRKYYHPVLGFNYRMTDVEAAIGLAQLERLDELVGKRRRNAAFLTERLSKLGGIQTPYVPEGVEHSYHQYSILIDSAALGLTRDEVAQALRDQGIGTGVHYPRPIHKQPAFEELLGVQSLPVSEEIAERILSLPVHPHLTQEDLERICTAVERVVHSRA